MGYNMNVSFTFGVALIELRNGNKIARIGWNGKEMFIFDIPRGSWNFETDVSDVDGLTALSFICMKTADYKLVPWSPSQIDLISNDWVIV